MSYHIRPIESLDETNQAHMHVFRGIKSIKYLFSGDIILNAEYYECETEYKIYHAQRLFYPNRIIWRLDDFSNEYTSSVFEMFYYTQIQTQMTKNIFNVNEIQIIYDIPTDIIRIIKHIALMVIKYTK